MRQNAASNGLDIRSVTVSRQAMSDQVQSGMPRPARQRALDAVFTLSI